MAPNVMGKSAGTSGNSTGLSKWQYALIFGTPVAAGLAYWYFKRARDKKKNTPDTAIAPGKAVETTQANHSRAASDVLDPLEKAKSFKNQGNKFFKEGKFDKAIECYTEAIVVCPKENSSELATFFQNRAAAFENLKNYREVIADCSRAIELNGNYVKALHRRAKAYELLEELKKCLHDITAVCILEGFQNQNSLVVTDRVLKKLGKATAKEVIKTRKPTLPSKHFIRNYFVSFCEDPIIQAVQACRQDKAPSQEDQQVKPSGYALAVECLAKEQFADVVAHCTSEISSGGPALPEALLLRGTFHLLQGQSQGTLEDLNQLLQLDNVDVKVRVNALIKLGTLKVHAEQLDEALQDFEKAAELDPGNADIFLHRGQVLMLLDRLEDTLQDMERSVSLRPDFPSAAAQRCYVQYRCGLRANDSGMQQEALEAFLEVQHRFPDCPECYFLHAQLLTETREFNRAEELFRKAEKADPTDPNVYVHLGILQLQWKQDFDKAVQYLQKAIEMDDKCQFAYETFGSVQVQRGQLKEGLALFEKAIALAQTEAELAHLLSLRDAADAQGKVAQRLGIPMGLS